MFFGIRHLIVLVAIVSIGAPGARRAAAAGPGDAATQNTDRKQDTDTGKAAARAALAEVRTADGLKALGEMLDRQWDQRPEWADMAVGILKGRAMGIGNGWFRPSRKRHDWDWLRAKLDADANARIDKAEFLAAAPRLASSFERLDRNLSGDLTEEDFDWTGKLPRTRDDAAARTSDLLFERVDADSNGRITRDEILQFFANVDRDGAGYWTPEDLYAALATPPAQAPAAPEDHARNVDTMLELLFTGQLGWFEPGPDVSEAAPDFTLATHDGASTVTLSERCASKPVVLVFGSFT